MGSECFADVIIFRHLHHNSYLFSFEVSMAKRSRNRNFSHSEILTLLEGVTEHKGMIHAAHSAQITNKALLLTNRSRNSTSERGSAIFTLDFADVPAVRAAVNPPGKIVCK